MVSQRVLSAVHGVVLLRHHGVVLLRHHGAALESLARVVPREVGARPALLRAVPGSLVRVAPVH